MPESTQSATQTSPSSVGPVSLHPHSAKLPTRPKVYFRPQLSSARRPKTVSALITLLTATILATSLTAQQPPHLQDPANLTGERVSPQDPADTLPINHGTPALQQLLLKLRTRASFMLIVAHPDDEDGGLLTYLSRGQGARVAMLTLNRGEGGQNLMSADFDDALGLIRTQELLAADRYMGVDQFFGTEVDFGFSKTKEESFAKWTHERVLYDAVRAVRLYRPLVIASVFIGGPSDGHGQHQVAGQIAQEVFNAAGDPKVFPDQIAQGLQPWQPLKVYARVPNARIVTDATGTQTIFDYATNQYTPARFTNYVTGQVSTTIPPANVVIPEGDPATYTFPDGTKTPIPGMENLSYVQFAAEGRSLQKTQFGPHPRLASPGPHDVSYTLYGSKLPCPVQIKQSPASTPAPQPLLGNPSLQARASSFPAANGALAPGVCPLSTLEPGLFSGIDTSLPGIADLAPEASDKLHPVLEKIDAQIVEAQRLFNPAKPELTAPPLHLALTTLDQFLHELEDPNINDLPSDETYNLLHELRIKRTQLNNALVLAHGLTLSASLADSIPGLPFLTTQLQFAVSTRLNNNGGETIDFSGLSLQSREDPKILSYFPPPTVRIPLTRGSSRTDLITTSTNPGLPATRPYFSRPNVEQPFYKIYDPALRNAPAAPNSLTALVTMEDHDVPLYLAATVTSSASVPTQSLVVVPPLSVSVLPSIGIVAPGTSSFAVNASLRYGTFAPVIASVLLQLPDGKTIESIESRFAFSATGVQADKSFNVPASAVHDRPLPVRVVASEGSLDFSEGFRAVGYPGLTITNYYTPATMRIVPVDVATAPKLYIAYLPGTGDDIPAALDQLAQLGVHTHVLTTADLIPESLKPYDAVILGVRAYETHPDLAAANAALNTYAANGGIVIAQYNTVRLPEGTGPYHLSLGASEKVVEEDAPVQILTPTNPLLTWPNKITSADFDHWIEERGHGFMATWDPHYTALLETHDHGQQPQRGGLLVARTGKGAWIYLGLALYRQLPEGVPGAYRILANLISAAKNPGLRPTGAPSRSPIHVTK